MKKNQKFNLSQKTLNYPKPDPFIILIHQQRLQPTSYPLIITPSLTVLFIFLEQVLPIFNDHFKFFEQQRMSQSISPWAPLSQVSLVRVSNFDFSVNVDTPPSHSLKLTLPVKWQPKEWWNAEGHSHLSHHVIIIQRSVVPMPVSEYRISHFLFSSFYFWSKILLKFL